MYTDEQVAAFRVRVINQLTEFGETNINLTCDNCPYLNNINCCSEVYDMYNTNGDCLAVK